jgi:tetratricopeptide (TPR) repeat protein
LAAQAKNANTPPDPSSPRLLITSFRMAPGTTPADGKLGVEMAAELRDRISSIIDDKTLWVVPRTVINQTLATSGYQPDSALQPSDIVALGKISQIGATETIDGVLARTADGNLRLTPKFYYNNTLEVNEPFAPVEGKTTAEIAKSWAEVYKGMRKEVPEFKMCQRSLSGSKPDSAATYARATIAMYPASMIGRLCLITAFDKLKSGPDSILRVGAEILEKDTTSEIALDFMRSAYADKGDNAKASEYAVKIFNLDPSNPAKAQTVINAMVNSGSPQKALPIVDTLIATNPGEKEPYLTKLAILMNIGDYKNAFKTADLAIKIDPTVADLAFYRRMIAAAQKDSDQVRFMDYLAKATKAYPKEADLQMGYYEALRNAGQMQPALDAAKRAVAADPKVPGGMIAIVSGYIQLKETDSALVFGKKALAAGDADSVRIGAALLSTLTPIYNVASDSATDNRANWEKLMAAAEQVDSIAPQAGSKFFIGLSAGQIGIKALQSASEAAQAKPPDAAVACADAKTSDAMFELARSSMSAGGKYNAAGAGAIMTAVSQYAAAPGQILTGLKCPTTAPRSR